MNGADGRRYCERMGGNLVTIRDEHEREYIHEHLDGAMGAIWLGAERSEPVLGEPKSLTVNVRSKQFKGNEHVVH